MIRMMEDDKEEGRFRSPSVVEANLARRAETVLARRFPDLAEHAAGKTFYVWLKYADILIISTGD
jgi:hypothetical protein